MLDTYLPSSGYILAYGRHPLNALYRSSLSASTEDITDLLSIHLMSTQTYRITS